MEKKYFLAIPFFFVLYSTLFPICSGTDLHFEDIKIDSSSAQSDDSSPVNFPYFPGKVCTAYTKSNSISVVGFLDGELLVKNGNSQYKNLLFENKSRIKTVYSVAISDDSKYVAAIVGADPKSLFIFKNKKGKWSILRQDMIKGDERRGSYLSFSGDVLFYETNGNIASYNMKDASCAVMDTGTKIRAVAYNPERGYLLVIAGHNLYIFKHNGNIVSALPYNSESDFLRLSGDIIMLDVDGKLCSARLVEGK